MAKRKVCVVTGSRAEYGILSTLMQGIKNSDDLQLQIIATGMHLSPEFGLTWKLIEEDGFTIDWKLEMLLSSDSPVGVTKSMGLGIIGFADALDRLRPDIMVLLGDRFEILAAAQAALIARIPVAHVSGGDTTEGAFDEAIRHSITKLSHIHFVTNEGSARRVRQLGEDPAAIHLVGNAGLDQIRNLRLMGREELEKSLNFTLRPKNILVTFHPATLDEQPADQQFNELLSALDRLGPQVGIIITKPNADTDGRQIIHMIDTYVSSRENTRAFVSLGHLRYLSLMAQVDAVVGNSSSGICETPSFRKPTVNIGDRQKGRLQAASVINCKPEAEAIVAAIAEAFDKDCSGVSNPYGDGNASPRMLRILQETKDYRTLLKKHFFQEDE